MRIHRKCNGLTFVCFSSRAVHVDISKDYSTDSFFQVMWQFSRRSTPIHQLVSVSKELKDAVSRLDQYKLQAFGVKHTL